MLFSPPPVSSVKSARCHVWPREGSFITALIWGRNTSRAEAPEASMCVCVPDETGQCVESVWAQPQRTLWVCRELETRIFIRITQVLFNRTFTPAFRETSESILEAGRVGTAGLRLFRCRELLYSLQTGTRNQSQLRLTRASRKSEDV